MRINHIALYVRDLETTKQFFMRFFGAEAGSLYHNPHTGLRTYFLTFDDGCRLELMSRPELAAASSHEKYQPGYVHLAFSVGGREQVDALTDKLQQNGYEVLGGPRTTGDGYYESCILGPEGNEIEITI